MRTRVEVMHGVSLDQLGRRDPAHYGGLTFDDLERRIDAHARWGDLDRSKPLPLPRRD